MKIGIQLAFNAINYSGGVQVQGRMWKDGLATLGHEVILMNNWDKYEYETFNFILILGHGYNFYDYVKRYSKYENIKIVYAPIIDYPKSIFSFKLRCRLVGSWNLKIRKPLHDVYKLRHNISLYLARSEYEKKYIIEGFGVPSERVKIIPISMRLDNVESVPINEKENICLHISRLSDPGKNVHNLILAAKKYNFNLMLGGSLNEEGKEWLNKEIGDSLNIKYLGWLTEEELKNIYRKAKVFALPSFIEGVGMVALEAAVFGAEIVLTDIGAPKEYYNGRAVLVNPYDIDSIGKGVIEAMDTKNAQPELRKYILSNYSLDVNMKQLESELLKLL